MVLQYFFQYKLNIRQFLREGYEDFVILESFYFGDLEIT